MFEQVRAKAALGILALTGATIGCGSSVPSSSKPEPAAQVRKFTDGEIIATIPTSDGNVVHRELTKIVSENPNSRFVSVVRTGPDNYTSADGAGFLVTLELGKVACNYKIEFVPTSEQDALADRFKEIKDNMIDYKVSHIIRTGPANYTSADGSGFVLVLAPKVAGPDNK
jgi:hypothetical protein